MNRRTTNLTISICNIVVAIILLIINLILNDLKTDVLEYTVSSNKTINILQNIYSITVLCIIIEMIIFNIISAIQNKENKKIMFSYILLAITAVIAIIAILFKLDSVVTLRTFLILSSVISIIQMIFIYEHEKEIVIDEEEEINLETAERIVDNIICNIIFIISIIIFLIVGIMYLKTKDNIIKENNQFIDNIIMQIKSQKTINEEYIRVSKAEKYGYIGADGTLKVECKYENATIFETLYILKKEHDIAIVLENNEYKIIAKDNQEINLGENPIPWLNNNENFDTVTTHLMSVIVDKGIEIKEETENQNVMNLTNNRYSNEYFSISIEDIDMSLGDYYLNEITVTKGEEVSKISKGYIPIEDDKTTSGTGVKLYSNGYIPFYDTEKEEQGWIDTYGKIVMVKGKEKVLDVKNNIVTLKTTEENIMFCDAEGNVLMMAKDVKIYKHGYIVRTNNDKIVYYDNDLVQKSEIYDYIQEDYIDIFNYTRYPMYNFYEVN